MDAVNFILVDYVKILNRLFENMGYKEEDPNEWEDQVFMNISIMEALNSFKQYLRFTDEHPEAIRSLLLDVYQLKIEQEKEKTKDESIYTKEQMMAILRIHTYERVKDAIRRVQFTTVDYEA